MFNKDLSYLYSDEYFTSSNETELSSQVSNYIDYRPNRTRICRKTAPILLSNRRSKHVVLFNEDALKRDKRRERNRILAKYLKEKQQVFEEDLYQKLKELENERSNLQNHITQLQSHKQNLNIEINENISMDSINDFNQDKIPSCLNQYSTEFDLFNISITNVLKLNNDYDNNIDH
jgi:hypothetical protein